MYRKTILAVVLACLLVLTGCVSTAPVSTEIGPPNVTSTTETEATTPSNESGVTAQFIVNNRGYDTYNVTLYVVQDLNESADLFPLVVTLRNGTSRTYTDTDNVQTLGEITAGAAEIEPANGTVVAVHQQLSPRSTLRIDVENAPEDAMSLGVIYRAGTQEASIESYGLSGQICMGSDADVTTFNENFSSHTSCGNVTHIAFSDSLSQHTVTVGNISEVGTGE